MEVQEWVEATHNTVLLWGDADLERVSLHTNLERLKVCLFFSSCVPITGIYENKHIWHRV